MQYHYHLQGFIYNLLKGSIYDQIHDMRGNKFFSFSNIFPANDLHQNDYRSLIISSPNKDLITYLYEMLQLLLGRGTQIKIGAMKFKIDNLHKLFTRVPDSSNFNLITGTPIIVRIPREKYKVYDFEPTIKSNYIYWRNGHPFDLFITQLKNNLLHKYVQYHELTNSISYTDTYKNMLETMTPQIFQNFEFKKQVSTRVFIKGFKQVIIGTLWEFGFNNNGNNSNNNSELIQFALDTGLGERNSLGFGFMNLPLPIKNDIYKENTPSETDLV
jgi:CRISPR-associated endoribonuclease Cas6